MGQYYKLITLSSQKTKSPKKIIRGWMDSFDYDSGSKLLEFSYVGNRFVNAFASLLSHTKRGIKVVCAGDYADNENDEETKNLYDYTRECPNKHILPKNGMDINKAYRYLINTDKKQFVDVEKVKENTSGYKLHPLPLLIAEGNGRGGGDYHANLPDFCNVGIWARDHIRVSDHKPLSKKYTELEVGFFEDF